MYWLASSFFQLLPASSERYSALCFDSIMAYTTFALEGATASAILPYGFSGRPWLFAGLISVQCSPPSVVLNNPLPGPPERIVQDHRRRRALDGDQSCKQPGPSGKAVRKNCTGGRAFQGECGVRHDRIEAERAVPLRRCGQELEETGCQPVHGVASVL